MKKSKTIKYNPIKKIKAYCVIQGRNSIADDTLYHWQFLGKKEPQKALMIFSAKRKALMWINQWKNYEDFTVVPIEFEIPEAN